MSVPHSFSSDRIVTHCGKYRRDHKLPGDYLNSPGIGEDLCMTCVLARHSTDAEGVTIEPCEYSKRKVDRHDKTS